MIEQHYSHLHAVKAIDQLRGEDSLSLLQDNSQINEKHNYKPEKKLGEDAQKVISLIQEKERDDC